MLRLYLVHGGRQSLVDHPTTREKRKGPAAEAGVLKALNGPAEARALIRTSGSRSAT